MASSAKAALALYTRQLAVLFRSGVPIVDGLQCVARGEDAKLNAVYADVGRRLQAGNYLSAAMKPHFPLYYVGLVKVGEESGSLQLVLERLADYLEARNRLERRIVSALTYPLVLALVSTALLLLLTVYIMPLMEPLFAQVGGQLPWITRLLLAFSHQFWRVESWATLGLVLLLAGFAVKQLFEAEPGTPLRRLRDRAVLEAPLFGKLARWSMIAELLRLFSLMAAAGIGIRQILRTLRESLQHTDFQDALLLMDQALQDGCTLAQAMNRSPVFPGPCVSMVQIAEESGRLAVMLDKVAGLYEDNVETLTGDIVALLEPLLLCFSSLFVGVVCLATLLPWLQLVTRLTH